MREVLVIAYYFPPIGGSGVVRIIKLAKYLPQFGWKPTVLTVDQGDAFNFDKTLLHELPDDVEIIRARSIEPLPTTRAKHALDHLRVSQKSTRLQQARNRLARLLKAVYFSVFFPDDKVGWLLPASRAVKRVASQHRFEIAFASSPPQTDLLVARRLKRELGLPIVLDYRDEWTTNPHKHIPNAFSLRLHRALERRVLNSADAITVVSQGMISNLAAAQLLTNDAVHRQVLPNGFDPADYAQAASSADPPKFRIVYTGSFYGEHRVPDPFLCALDRWLAEHPAVRGNVEVDFYGSVYPRHLHLIDALGLDDVVNIPGETPHKEAILAQCNASLLLLIIGAGEGKAILTGKIFEYFGAQRPILALIPPDGEAADVIKKTATGIVIAPQDTAKAASVLHTYYEQWQNHGILYAPNVAEVKQYSRVQQAQELAELFDRIIDEPKP